MMSDEEWRDIPGFKGRYWVSSLGQVRNARGWILRPRLAGKRGHLRVELGASMNRYISSLVLHAFRRRRPEGYEVFFKDNNPQNVALSNLCWIKRGNNKRRRAAASKTMKGRPRASRSTAEVGCGCNEAYK